MAKDYLCKDCDFNKNGWCSIKSIQGLKGITDCEYKDSSSIEEESTFKPQEYKQFGKREMFYFIQSQIMAIDTDSSVEDKFKVLKQVMVSLEKVLRSEEKFIGIALEYEIDRDIYEASKAISEKLLKEVGMYNGK